MTHGNPGTGNPAAGWYPDPEPGSGHLRWWDGAKWTKHTAPGSDPIGIGNPVTGAADGPPASTYGSDPAQGGPGYGGGSGPAYGGQGQGGPAQGGWGGPGPYGPGGGGWGPMGGGPMGGWGGRRGPVPTGPGGRAVGGTFFHRNQLSLIAIGVAAVYVVIAITSRVVFFGILPILMSVRAMTRREALAPFAVAAAIITIVLAVVVVSHH